MSMCPATSQEETSGTGWENRHGAVWWDCENTMAVWEKLGLWAVTVEGSTQSGLPGYLVRDIDGEFELILGTAQILCVVLVAEWTNNKPTGASTQALVSFEKSEAESTPTENKPPL